MIPRRACFLAALALVFSGFAHAATLAGKWTAEFDSQIGPQKYAYDFKADGEKITGTAKYSHSMGQGENVLSEIKVTGDDVAFAEVLRFDGNEIVVTYKGKFVGEEVKLTREVGTFATEQIVLKRVHEPASATP